MAREGELSSVGRLPVGGQTVGGNGGESEARLMRKELRARLFVLRTATTTSTSADCRSREPTRGAV